VPLETGNRQEAGTEGPAGKDEPEPMLNHSECIMAKRDMGVKGELAQFSHPSAPGMIWPPGSPALDFGIPLRGRLWLDSAHED